MTIPKARISVRAFGVILPMIGGTSEAGIIAISTVAVRLHRWTSWLGSTLDRSVSSLVVRAQSNVGLFHGGPSAGDPTTVKVV